MKFATAAAALSAIPLIAFAVAGSPPNVAPMAVPSNAASVRGPDFGTMEDIIVTADRDADLKATRSAASQT